MSFPLFNSLPESLQGLIWDVALSERSNPILFEPFQCRYQLRDLAGHQIFSPYGFEPLLHYSETQCTSRRPSMLPMSPHRSFKAGIFLETNFDLLHRDHTRFEGIPVPDVTHVQLDWVSCFVHYRCILL